MYEEALKYLSEIFLNALDDQILLTFYLLLIYIEPNDF